MIEMPENWVLVLGAAAFFGAIGGLVYELISSHTPVERELGRIELPGGKRLVDWGFFASMIVGAVSAIGFLYFLEPRSLEVNGVETTAYDTIKLAAASVLVGSGGPSVLRSMRERLWRAQSEEKTDTARRIAGDAVHGIKEGEELSAEHHAATLKAILSALS